MNRPYEISKRKDIKVIGLDLDGTLLNSDKKLSAFTYETLKEAADRGIEIVPSTGRYFGAMPSIIREMPFVHYCITINGASVANVKTGEKLYKAEIPLAEAIDIMTYLDTLPVIYDCYMSDTGWMTAEFKNHVDEHVVTPHYRAMVRDLRKDVPELKAFIKEQGKDIQKIQFFSNDHALQQRLLYHGHELFPDVICTCSVKDENVEFNQAKANKGDALTGVARVLGYDAENTMSFGDGSNDIPMIKSAGVGVAMANACPEALAASDYVTYTNDEDGVARFIRDYCFT